jgi:hypothetical protein
MTAPILLVCGFGRCGTSLVMQMLDTGGVPVIGRAPAYEEMVPPGAGVDYWRENFSGRAMKLLDPQRHRPPAGLDYRILWLDRDFHQQALSQVKLLTDLSGIKLNGPKKVIVKRMERLNILERPRAIATIRTVAGDKNCASLFFEQIINAPHIAAKRLWDVFGRYSTIKDELPDEIVLRMASLIKFRSSDNYPGLLELDLVSQCKKVA